MDMYLGLSIPKFLLLATLAEDGGFGQSPLLPIKGTHSIILLASSLLPSDDGKDG